MADQQVLGNVGEFSNTSRYFCHCDPNGIVKIWDATTGLLKQQYAPSSHLSVLCTCVSWSPNGGAAASSKNRSPKKKKRKVENAKFENECEIIALGNTDGSILLYNVNEADVHSQLVGGHDGPVTAICWSRDGSRLYSCSSDEFIIEWDVAKSAVTSKWKSGHGSLTSITLCHSQEHLLAANTSIYLWDLKTKKVIQTFVGHATEVFKLCEVPSTRHLQNCNNSVDCHDDDDARAVEGNYIVSMARGENKISVRQISNSERSAELLASFAVTEEPIMIDINLPTNEKQTVQMVVVTKHGKVAYFESVLNGRQKKPLKAKKVSSVVSKDGDKVKNLPVVASAFNAGDGSICFVYEDFIVPVFEIIPVNDLQDQLIRKDPRTAKKASQKSKRGFADTEEKEVASISGKKIKLDEMALGDRLAAEEKMLEAKPEAKTVKVESSAILLAQGLRSKDKKILNAVLQKTNPSYVTSTVSELPVTHLASLLAELHRRLAGHAQSGKGAARWMRTVLGVHGSYLAATPSNHELLEPIVQTIEMPVQSFAKILQLKGRLECFATQPTSKDAHTNDKQESFNCEINHVDDINIDGYKVDAAVSEDEWEEDESGN